MSSIGGIVVMFMKIPTGNIIDKAVTIRIFPVRKNRNEIARVNHSVGVLIRNPRIPCIVFYGESTIAIGIIFCTSLGKRQLTSIEIKTIEQVGRLPIDPGIQNGDDGLRRPYMQLPRFISVDTRTNGSLNLEGQTAFMIYRNMRKQLPRIFITRIVRSI